MRSGRYAALDIGTVTCRLLVADVDEHGSIHELERGYGITNLGEGVDATGCLKPEAMQRVVDRVSLFLETIASHEDEAHPHIPLTAMATSASRDAHNGDEFRARLRALGVDLSIIAGSKEAALSFAGVSQDFSEENLLVVDVGGGSTEFSAGYAGADPLLSHSFDVGCRRVTERYLTLDPPTDEQLDQAREWIKESFGFYFDRLSDSGFQADRMVGVAGTATSVVSIHKNMRVYDKDQVHRSKVTRDILIEVYDRLRRVDLAERKRTVGLDPGRAPVIVAGLLILDVAMEYADKSSFTVSESDILQGIILDTAAK